MKLFEFEVEIGSKENPIIILLLNDQNVGTWFVVLAVIVIVFALFK